MINPYGWRITEEGQSEARVWPCESPLSEQTLAGLLPVAVLRDTSTAQALPTLVWPWHVSRFLKSAIVNLVSDHWRFVVSF